MKRIVETMWILVLCLLTTEAAFASRARLMVYGSGDPTDIVLDPNGTGGSYYYESPYSMVYNPALLLDSSDQLIIEKSNETGVTAQGTLIKSFDGFSAGAILSRKGEAANYANASKIRPMEFYFAGGKGQFKGGLGLSFFEYFNDRTPDRDLKIKVGGVIAANEKLSVEPFAHYKIIGREKTQSAYPKHKDFAFGFRTLFNQNLKFFTAYRKYKVKNDANNMQRDAFGFGVGHQVAVDSKTNLIYALGFWRKTNTDRNIIPINVAAEKTILSWLWVRGGLQYRFHDVQNETSVDENTTGRIGLTAGADQLFFDFVIGSAASGALEGASDADSQSFGFDSGTFTAAALRYNW